MSSEVRLREQPALHGLVPAARREVPGDALSDRSTVGPGGGPDDEPTGGRPRRPRWAVAAVVALVVALAASLAAVVYLVDVADRWQARAEQLSSRVGDLQSQQAALQSRAAATETELGQASDRVRQLSGEKAQVADEREANAQAAARSTAVARSASDVAQAMGTCASSLRQLLDVVLSSPDYDHAVAERSATDADTACAAAQRQQQDFLDSLGS